MTAKHLPALDGLRGVAVLIVMASHVFNTELIPGVYGVTLFFFISGFIITKMMLDQAFTTAHFKAFYVRRFFRLAPALFTFMLCAGLLFWGLGYPLPAADFAATLLYYANYHEYAHIVDMSSPFELTWSLAVEEHFYFVFPLLLALTQRAKLVPVLAGLAVVILIWRTTAVLELGVYRTHVTRHTDTRLDSIVWGCLLSALIHSQSRLLVFLGDARVLLLAVAVTLVDFAIRNANYRETLHFSVQGLVLMVVFCNLFWSHTAPRWIEELLSSSVLQFFGRISYSLYLYHFTILVMCRILLPQSPIRTLCAIGGGIIAAYVSYKFVETPLRRYGARLARSFEQPATSTETATFSA